MTQTCTAQTHISSSSRRRCSAVTLIELMVALVMVSLFVLLAVPSLFGLLRKNTFKAQLEQFVSAMQMAVTAAAESNRRYEVLIDLTDQYYLLREITSPDLSQVFEEEIILERDFGDKCWAAYVLFDDVDFSLEGESYANEGRAMFRAGHAGWHYGGKIVLLDENEQPYSVVVNRMNRIVTLEAGDVELPAPRRTDEVLF
ncbi:MAG TPA: prepilin-type N-terminal cleavage/methylation domain-containing protein [Sedimentisphaerales bacterium]|nr:prepilin-type N-terminal cleavage/methylation domain-containing protein [Sedimentisphaerales bacterium]